MLFRYGYMPVVVILQMVVRDALNSAIDEEMAADPKVFVIGEEVSLRCNRFASFACP